MVANRTIVLEGIKYEYTAYGWVEVETGIQASILITLQLTRLAAAHIRQEQAAPIDIDQTLQAASNAQANHELLKAERFIRQVLKQDNLHLGAYAMLCAVLRDRKCPQQALEEAAGVAVASYPPLLTSRAAALCDLERWEEAKHEIARVLAMGGSEEAFKVMRRIKQARPDLYTNTIKQRR